jgi:CheY-like chemotaxis protein
VSSLEVINRLLAVEEAAGALYQALSERFADHPELHALWSELAEDERTHAGLLGEVREGLVRGEIPSDVVRVEAGPAEQALQNIYRQREHLGRGGMSVAEALAATIALETSEINDVLTRVMAAVRPYLPSLLVVEGIVSHLRRLLSAVDRLSHPELTVVLRALVDQVARRGAAPPKILIVDDESDMRETCVRIFARDGYRCQAVTDGQEALDLLEGERPDLILTDLRMPRVDGLTLLRHVQRLPFPPPVVVFTAYVSEGSIREVLEAGAAAYLPKPFTPRKLREVVEPLLSPRRSLS